MKKAVKIWLITAAVLVVLGIGLMTAALAAADFDITKIGTIEYVTNTYKVTEKFDKIVIDENASDIELAVSDNKQCSVVCREPNRISHSAVVKNGVLTIGTVDDRRWYESVGLTFESPKMTVYLPEKVYDSLTVSVTSGDIIIPDAFTFNSIEITGSTSDIQCAASVTDHIQLTATTGDIKLSGVKAKKDITIRTTTGDITLDRAVSDNALFAESTTGDVFLDRCDAKELTIETTTGDITGSLLSAKAFSAHTTVGDVSVPDSNASGGKCSLTTTTGDILITLK